jgi:hypothetical protein
VVAASLAALLLASQPSASETAAPCPPGVVADQCAVAEEIREAARGPGRGLVAALVEGRLTAEQVWAADAALHAALGGPEEAPRVGGLLLEVVFRRAGAGDCGAARALERLAATAVAPHAGVLAKRIGRLVLTRPEAVRGCWPAYERVLPAVQLERSVLCDERPRATALYGRCACASEACREVLKVLAALPCGEPPRAPGQPAGPLRPAGCS